MLEAISPPDAANEPLLASAGCDEFESETGQQALKYARRGWPVLPLESVSSSGECSCGDRECANPGKHPMTPHGVGDATVARRKDRPLETVPANSALVSTCAAMAVTSLRLHPCMRTVASTRFCLSTIQLKFQKTGWSC